jgi:hypothetical protein
MKVKQSKKNEYSTVSLPTPLVEEIKKRISGTGIHSVSSYVTFVLRQIISSKDSKELIEKDTETEIIRRLKSLGYI